MHKVAIVGVEGSGKTVMLAGLGELYSQPDEQGYFLSPKNYSTVHYVDQTIAKMRKGEWPMATAEDLLQGLDWTLRKKWPGGKPQDICAISCLDFAGEVYRTAFCSTGQHEESDEEKTLKRYIDECDDLIVLINLRDVIANGFKDKRVQESMWITNAILAYALDEPKGRKQKRAAIVLSQADSYKSTIESCGGAVGVLEKYLPHVYNSYDWLDIFDASAVDLVRVGDDGQVYPHPDFQPILLKPVIEWVRKGAVKSILEQSNRPLNKTNSQAKKEQLRTGAVKQENSTGFTWDEFWKGLSGIIMFILLICKIVKGCS